MNFKNLGNQTAEVGNGRPPGGFHLARQGSIYSLTFDELQNTMGGSIGKDFGSLNMDELLKSIWNAEEVQTTGTNTGVPEPAGDGGANIQRQGSLTLPRTLSQKTVDEVWKDISKEFTGFGQPNLPQRQQTLGEMTLEEFLVKAGVVREEPPQLPSKQNDNGLFPNLTNPQNNSGFGATGFQQAPARNNNQIAFQPANLPLNVNGVRSNPQQQQIFPKQPKLSYGAPMAAIPPSKQIGRNGIVGLSDPAMNGNLVSNGMMGAMVAVGSPAVSSDGIGKTNGDTSSVSPVPYEFSGAMRGRKSGAVEKVVERRQRRMIKNRESAARSRARKQAYTMELEAEVSKLKEQNQELKRKAEMMEMQQNQVMEMMNTQPGAKRRYMRRTQSGPW
ncbi:unnamed protein product [Lactuca saligna]|uniref:BZIP domain-containing protein n=1 Tax=Lactuca saligna TaxID=75948 RepID=A0AA35VDR4_LACSI|nr:unnamed protein product [Lactuca saligna]